VTGGRASRAQARLRGLAVLIGVLCLSAAAGFLSHRLVAHRAHMYPLSGAAMGRPPSASADRGESVPAPTRVPDNIPDISLPGLDGKVHSLREWKDRPLVVNFWATWCEPCRREIPLLLELRRENAAKGLEIVGIAIDEVDPVRKYARDHGMDYPLLLGEREGLEAARAFGMETVLPFSVFADRHGNVVTLKVGELHAEEARLILGRIAEVDAGRLPLAAARADISAGIRALRRSSAPAD
jgi:thiol-disulfide isomerase/thioredoxin